MLNEILVCVLGIVFFLLGVIGLSLLRFRREETSSIKIALLRYLWCAVSMGAPLILHLPIVVMRYRISQYAGYVPTAHKSAWHSALAQDAIYQGASRLTHFTLPLFLAFVVGVVIMLHCDTRWRYVRLRDYWCIAFAFFVACFFVLGSATLSWWLD